MISSVGSAMTHANGLQHIEYVSTQRDWPCTLLHRFNGQTCNRMVEEEETGPALQTITRVRSRIIWDFWRISTAFAEFAELLRTSAELLTRPFSKQNSVLDSLGQGASAEP